MLYGWPWFKYLHAFIIYQVGHGTDLQLIEASLHNDSADCLHPFAEHTKFAAQFAHGLISKVI